MSHGSLGFFSYYEVKRSCEFLKSQKSDLSFYSNYFKGDESPHAPFI